MTTIIHPMALEALAQDEVIRDYLRKSEGLSWGKKDTFVYKVTPDMLVIFPKVIAVVGTRDFEPGNRQRYFDKNRKDYISTEELLEIPQYQLIDKVIRFYLQNTPKTDFAIISGEARGVDTLAERWCIENKVSFCGFPADWDNLGKGAGFIRNQTIVDNCTHLIAIWDGRSGGTNNTITRAKEKGINPRIINYQDEGTCKQWNYTHP